MALHILNNSTGYGARDAARALKDELGIEIVTTEEHTTTTVSEIDSLTRIKALKPDVLYISSTPQPTSIVIKNAVELSMYPGITIGLGHASITSKLIEFAGANIVEGVYGVYPTVNWGDDVPAMAKMTEYCQKYHSADYGNMDYITSWAEGLIVAEILRLAIENVGVDELTPQAVEEYGFKKLSNFNPGGLHGLVSYTPGDNRFSKSVRVFQIQSGNITPISDWIEAPLVKYEEYDWFGK
jgi:branched-chain amino acid transport system substrate-binding protein